VVALWSGNDIGRLVVWAAVVLGVVVLLFVERRVSAQRKAGPEPES
jgi:hypothetical protein